MNRQEEKSVLEEGVSPATEMDPIIAERDESSSEGAWEGVQENEQESTQEDGTRDSQPEAKRTRARAWGRKRFGMTVGVIIAIVVVAGAGFWCWHEQPSFCNAICHTPMDPYLPTYEASSGEAGAETAVDKWGNEVADTSGMLAAVHAQVGKTCLDCHVPSLDEQVTEGVEWVSGSYEAPLQERALDELVRARGLEDTDEFCMNESCHPYTRDDLAKKTAWMGEINPHDPQHGEQECGTCHKAHRSSVMYCTQCHSEAVVPDGWVTYEESVALEEGRAE